MTEPRHLVRVRFGSATVERAVPPLDTVHYRIFHPARFEDTPLQRMTGSLPADDRRAPWPAVIVLGGINVNPDTYRWLATDLAGRGIATVILHHVGEISPGEVGLSPGLDLTALTPEAFGGRPSATALGPVIDALADEAKDGPLAGLLDLDRIVVAGHSAGGTVALLNADPAWFRGVVAAISYAGHTMPATMIGHPVGTVLASPAGVPALLFGGGRDDVIAASAVRYSEDGGPTDDHDPIHATFDRGTTAPGSTLVMLAEATHLTLCDPVDPTSARGFLEEPDLHGPDHRRIIAGIIAAFIDDVTGESPGSSDAVSAFASEPLVSELRRW